MGEAKVWPQYLAALSAAGGAFSLGAAIGWTAPSELKLERGEFGFDLLLAQFAWIGSLLTLGAAAVCIPIGFVMDWIGRKPTMLMMVVPFALGWLLVIFAKNIIMLYVGRFILGVAGGAFCITVPVYTTEIAQNHTRGRMGSFFQMLIVSGVLFSYIVGTFANAFVTSIICGTCPIVFGCIFVWMPESPWYYISKDQTDNAKESLLWLRGPDYNSNDEIQEMEITRELKKNIGSKVHHPLFRYATIRGLFISICLMVFQQLSGINAIVFYSTSIFSNARTDMNPEMVTILIGSLMVAATLAALVIVDIWGRRKLLILSATFMAVSDCGVGFYFIIADNGDAVGHIQWLPTSSVCLYMLVFSIGFGPVPWILNAELFLDDVKCIMGPIAGMMNWLSAFLVTCTFQPLRELMGTGPVFLVYALVCVVAVAFVLLLVPETKNRRMVEIQYYLEGKSFSI